MTPAAPALAYDPQPNIQWGGSQEPRPSPVTPDPITPQGDISWEGSERLMCPVSPASSPTLRPSSGGSGERGDESRVLTQGLWPTPSHLAAVCSI